MREWSEYVDQSRQEVEREEARLPVYGFEEGVTAFFIGPKETPRQRREAVSDAFVFSSAHGAEQELGSLVAEDIAVFPKRGLRRYTVPAIPGSVGLGEWLDHGKHGGAGNVLFAVGRCTFVIGDSIHARTSRAGVERPSTTAALALYGRAKTLCA